MTPRPVRSFAPLLTGLVLAACAGEAPEQAAAPAQGPLVVEVVASDYAFQMPDTLTAGATHFRLINNGTEVHHIQLIRLDEGKTIADMAAVPHDAPPPAWMVPVGGPNTPRPGGGVSEGLVDLAPGNYAVTCMIPSPDGQLHIMKGMVKPLTVLPADAPRPMPEAGTTITLNDYSFTITPALTPGRHVIRVENLGQQPHEVVLMKLAEGKTAQDVAAWVDGGLQGPPPAEPVGGTSAFAVGVQNYIIADLAPGEYGLLCFFPDKGDGRMHTAHGMIQQISVR